MDTILPLLDVCLGQALTLLIIAMGHIDRPSGLWLET